jgi:hypothetical protein
MGVTASPQASLVIPSLIGDDAGGSMPATWKVCLGSGDPRRGGTELSSSGGYARVDLSNASSAWTGIPTGVASALVTFDEPTGAWSDEATHLWLLHPSHLSKPFAVQELSRPIAIVSGSDPAPKIRVRVTDAEIGVF